MAGTWKQLPSNCTRNLGLTLVRCAQLGQTIRTACVGWANQVEQSCAQWADQGHSECAAWSDHGHNECCDWAPCSWFCDAFYWVANVLCDAFYWVANVVCVVFTTIVKVVCVLVSIIVEVFCALWSIITIFFCVSTANGGTALLLTDGTVLMQECLLGYGTRRWWKLVPDNTGSYFNGTWRRVRDANVGRKYFASAVLADGRVLVCGGEYSDASGMNAADETNTCEIYDPVADTWTAIDPPRDAGGAFWAKIGDAACSLLADGTFLMGNAMDRQTATFDPATNAWSLAGGKRNRATEESWVLLRDQTVSTPNCSGHPAAEKYLPATRTWMADRSIPAASDIVEDASSETGPGVLLPDGRAFWVGATGKTVLYTAPATANAQGTWMAGPDLPKAGRMEQGTKDGPGCLLVNGNVLFGIAPVNGKGGEEDYLSPTSFFEFDGTGVNRVSDPPNSNHATYVGRMLLLPNGDVMFMREDDSSFYAYTDYGRPQDIWRPVIQACPGMIQPGHTIQVSGLNFNGFSQAVGYGDDSTAATNYPLVRIRHRQSGHVAYCCTFNHTTPDAAGNPVPSMGVATGAAVITTHVAVPAGLPLGDSDLFVVANGIESLPFRVDIVHRRKD
ncbi:MAG: hypothetical protein HXX12_13220 [Geothrix sp.]|uniref:kelch repeat-containing protein n=1 Tax=Geothrix sp. TaxID=1962974 RepID=UPI0018060C12|nr:kelch repeat-containing protein [Geothrix sp.]NWJ41916.1 hypothetical protein [Geothrix sp.]WIL20111.1 MAG: kelch motif-containing protein [Geothrix sp.]